MAFCTVLLLGASACGSDDDAADPQPTTTNPTTTQSQEAEDEQALRQLAEDWYETSRAAYLEADFDLDRLEDFLVDPYAAGFLAQLEEYREQGRTSEAGEASRHVVETVEVEGDAAVVQECIVDGELLLDASGAIVNDEVVTSRVRTTAERTESGWRFSDRAAAGDDEEGDACAE